MEACPSFVLLAPGRRVRCTAPTDHRHDPDFVVHVGSVRVTLPDGREHAAMLLWTEADSAARDVADAD